MSLNIDLSGQRALVSGVTSGIGLSIAEQLSAAGCSVAGCGSRPPGTEGAQSFIRAVEAHGNKAVYIQANLGTAKGARHFAAEGIAALNGIDILVSNAGRNIFKGAATCSDEDWSSCMQLDLAAHWQLAQACRESLKTNNGTIIVIGSNHSRATIPGCFPYNVAKAGLSALVQSLTIEWGPHIRTVGIDPGFIDTAGNDTWFGSFPDPAAERSRTESLHPVGRIGKPAEIGALTAFLASSHAAFIAGTSLLVDGGRSALMQDT
jgi:NAD(P)-dependent dehydrogenase (short-subunit alcohol dehydrogenase family)